MLVHNKGLYIRNAAGVTITPGANEVTESAWKKFSGNALMKHLIEAGEIEAATGDSTKGLSAEKAIALVRDTFSPSLLADWQESETRKTVLEAISEQLESLRGTGDE